MKLQSITLHYINGNHFWKVNLHSKKCHCPIIFLAVAGSGKLHCLKDHVFCDKKQGSKVTVKMKL